MKKYPLTKTDFDEFKKWLFNLRVDSVLAMNLQTCFYENFTVEELPVTTEIPPSGLTPKSIHNENRKFEIIQAIDGYKKAGLNIPAEWYKEFWELY